MSVTSKNIFTWDKSSKGPRGFPGAAGGISIPDAGDILTNLLTVDGTGSGLDADLLDGNHAAYFAPIASPTITGTISLAGNTIIGTHDGSIVLDIERYSAAVPYGTLRAGSSDVDVPVGLKFQTRIADGSVVDALVITGTTTEALGDLKITSAAPLLWLKDTSSANTGFFIYGDASVLNFTQASDAGGTGVNLLSISRSTGSINTTGGVHIGGTSDAGADNLLVDGTAEVTGVSLFTGLVKTVGGIHVGGSSDPGTDNLWIDGNAQEPSFAAGWQGTNWQIQADGDAEFNNVRIRGGLSVYELIINQLHYQNGGLIIGAGAGKVATIVTATPGSEVLTFQDPEGNSMVPFTAGSIVMCQRVDISKTVANGYTGDIVKKIVRQVASVASMEVTLTTTTGWLVGDDTGIFELGDEVCAIGHISNTSLDSSIYLSATDADNPFMRIYDGVNTYGKFSLGDKTTIKLQLGNLASLASYDILPASPGYGLYCNNVYLTGKMVLPTAGMTDEGALSSSIRIYAGDSYANRATAPFRVTQDGSLTATGIAELGTATASYGGINSNIAIKNADIWENSYNGENSGVHINRLGYNGGATWARDLYVYDGKGVALLTTEGASKEVRITVSASLKVYGTALFNTSVLFGDTFGVGGAATGSILVNLVSTSKALVVTRMTTTQRDAMTAAQGMIIYNTTTNQFNGCNNAGWYQFTLS